VALGVDLILRWWDVGTGEQTRSLKLGVKNVNGSRLSQDGGRFLYSSTDGKAVHLIELPSGKEVAHFEVNPVPSAWMSFSPDGRTLASACEDTTVKLWNVTTGRAVLTLRGHTAPVYSVAFAPDGKWAATASLDRTVRLWRLPEPPPAKENP
jgi:WD40 repeat protein